MPKTLKKKLAQRAKKKGLTGSRKDAYVYGTLNRIEESAKKKKKK